MKTFEVVLEKLFKFFASLKLAIIVLSGLAIVCAVGTVVEAQYDAQYAQKMVYLSPVMFLLQALLVVNLFNVMIDRLPWKRHHIGFVLAHVGIITIIGGSVITHLAGVDGTMSFDIGQKNRFAMISAETEFAIYSNFGSGNYQLMHKSLSDFLLEDPKEKKQEFTLGNKVLTIKDFYPFAFRQESIEPSDKNEDGPGLRFQIQNDRVNMSQWILRDHRKEGDVLELGPARVVLADNPTAYQGKNEIVFWPTSKGDYLNYRVYTASKGGQSKAGKVKAGDSIDLGWMGLQFRILKYIPHAKQKIVYIKKERPTELTLPALSFDFDGDEYWLGLNSSVRLFEADKMYMVVYANRRVDVGFDIQLDKFSVGRYQGTMRAASYASDVTLPDGSQHNISMNNPLKHNGFTFYQASFQENEKGEPITSILSVNRDPGRWVKYIGAMLIVLGIIIMFYFKRLAIRAKKPEVPK